MVIREAEETKSCATARQFSITENKSKSDTSDEETDIEDVYKDF
jgi:hypothetical protein